MVAFFKVWYLDKNQYKAKKKAKQTAVQYSEDLLKIHVNPKVVPFEMLVEGYATLQSSGFVFTLSHDGHMNLNNKTGMIYLEAMFQDKNCLKVRSAKKFS